MENNASVADEWPVPLRMDISHLDIPLGLVVLRTPMLH